MDLSLSLVLALVFIVALTLPVAWALEDAQKRGRSTLFIVLLFVLTGPMCALVWLIVRPLNKLMDSSASDYGNPDDALADAAKLFYAGEWKSAERLNREVAVRWPETTDFVKENLNLIQVRMKS